MEKEKLVEVFGNLLLRLPDVKHHHIESENPDHHWNFLKADGEVVLDLGCGLHYIESGWLSTPEYFISKGAKKVIGIDTEGSDIIYFKNKLPHHDFHHDAINSVDKLDFYINTNQVTSLKMDIEGYETCFINSNDQYATLKHVAIETHSRSLMNQMVNRLLELNFKIDVLCTFYPRVFEICNLIYATRS